MSQSPPANAELALLLEVAATPKPGSVDRKRDLADLRFEQFLAGAVGAAGGLRMAAAGAPLGTAFERAVAGMSRRAGENTQFGALLLLVPLVRAATRGKLSPSGLERVVGATTVADAAAFYRAFERVDVAVGEPPEGMADLDVRRGGDAAPALRERGLTLSDVMQRSADRDGNAREWTRGFPRTFAAAESIETDEGSVTDRAARAFLDLLADEPDSLVATRHGIGTARCVSERAAAADSPAEVESLAEDLVADGINPGTTADQVAAALFVALERGVEV